MYRACTQARRRPHLYHQRRNRILVVRPRGDRLRAIKAYLVNEQSDRTAASRSRRGRRVGDPEVVPASRYGECALNIGDTDVADIIIGHLHGDPAENRATLALDDAFRSILDATAAIRERPTTSSTSPARSSSSTP